MKKRILAMLLCICMAVSLMPTVVLADDAGTAITGSTTITAGGIYTLTPVDASATIDITVSTAEPVTIKGPAEQTVKGTITISTADADVTLDTVTMTGSGYFAISVGADATLRLVNANKLRATYATGTQTGAIKIAANKTLTIEGQGSLDVAGNGYGAGIYVPQNATLTINSGTIEAKGGDYGGAAIGADSNAGGAAGSAGTINITGGQITATARGNGAAIGGGGPTGGGAPSKNAGTVNISGGKVAASASKGSAFGTGVSGGGAAIPGDFNFSLTVTGGDVTANGKIQGTVNVSGTNTVFRQEGTVAAGSLDKLAVTITDAKYIVGTTGKVSGAAVYTLTGGTIENNGVFTPNSFTFTSGTLDAKVDTLLAGTANALTGTVKAGSNLSCEPTSTYTLAGELENATLTAGTLTVDATSTLTGTTDIQSGAGLILATADSAAATISGPAAVQTGATISGTGFVSGDLTINSGATTSALNALYTVADGTVTGFNASAGGNVTTVKVYDSGEKSFTLTVNGVVYSGTTGSDGSAVLNTTTVSNAAAVITRDDNVSYSGTVTIRGNNMNDDTYAETNVIDIADFIVLAPVVTVSTPANLATGVSAGTQNIVLTLDQAVTAGPYMVQLAEGTTVYRQVIEAADIKTEDNISTITLPINGFTNGTTYLGLKPNTSYTLTLKAGGLVGIAGNKLEETVITFATTTNYQTVNLSVSGSGTLTGTVSGSNRLTVTGDNAVAVGSTIALTAMPSEGYVVDKWEATDRTTNVMSVVQTGGETYELNTDSYKALKVTFKIEGDLNLTLEPEGPVTVEMGASVQVYCTVTPSVALTHNVKDPTVAASSLSGSTLSITGKKVGETEVYMVLPDGSFKTIQVKVVEKSTEEPEVTTGEATNITGSGAVLNGTVDPNGGEVLDVGFRIMCFGGGYLSISGSYDETTGKVSAALNTLTPATTYYYHTYIETAGGTFYGDTDVEFKTQKQVEYIDTAIQPTISVGAGGSAKLSGSTLIITPDDGYKVDNVTINGVSQGAVTKITGLKNSDKVVVIFKKEAKTTFTDVPDGVFYTEAVAWAVENGVTNGTSDITFSPARDITRAEAVTFIWRAAGKPMPTKANPFTDVTASLGSDMYYAILWAYENGITNGKTATEFAPLAKVTRGEMVTFLCRFADGDAIANTTVFTDVTAGAFYYEPVIWAVENGITNGKSLTSFAPNANVNRAEAVTFLYRLCK